MGILISLLMSQNTDLSILMTQCTYITYTGETNNFRVTLLQLLSDCAKSIVKWFYSFDKSVIMKPFSELISAFRSSAQFRTKTFLEGRNEGNRFSNGRIKKSFLKIVKQTGPDEKSFERGQTWFEPIAVGSETLSWGWAELARHLKSGAVCLM